MKRSSEASFENAIETTRIDGLFSSTIEQFEGCRLALITTADQINSEEMVA